VLLRGEYMISGITNKALRQQFPGKTSGQISRLLKRLRVLGLIKKVGPHYKYYLTHLGRQSAVLAVKLREMYVIPYFSYSKPQITWA
jgi:DNA-binding HxlR family transcriptional regulator